MDKHIYVVIKWQLYLVVVTHVRQHLVRPLCLTDSSTLNGNFFWNLDGRISLKTKMDLFSSCNIFVVGCRACNLLLCTMHKKMHKSRCTLYIYSYLIFVISFTQAFCAVEIFYTQNALFVTKLNLHQNNVNRSNALCKMIHCTMCRLLIRMPLYTKMPCVVYRATSSGSVFDTEA